MAIHRCWIVQETGYFFPFLQTEQTDEWPFVQAQLETLASEGKVHETVDGFLLPHAVAVSLETEVSDILELPAFFPYEIMIRSHGSLGTSSFRYKLEYRKHGGASLYGVVVQGSYVRLSSKTDYRLNED